MTNVDVTDKSTQLPLELWRDIFEQTHDATGLRSSARSCRFLQIEAEAVLYKSIALHSFIQVQRLKDTLQSSPRRTAAVRTFYAIFDPGVWPRAESGGKVIISDDAAQCLNALLVMLTNLQSLAIRRGSGGYHAGLSDAILRGCTFNLRTFTSAFETDAGLFDFLGKQPMIEELNMQPGLIPASFVLPKELLPRLKILRTSERIVLGLQAPHSITHLTMLYESPSTVDFVIKLLGHQLVYLNLGRYGISPGNALPFTDSESVDLPCLTHVATRTVTSGELVNIAAHKPINLKTFYPPRAPTKIWEWYVWSAAHNEPGSKTREKYNASVTWFAGKILHEWPSLEKFVFKRLGYMTSITYSLDENDQLIQREDHYAEPLQWRQW